MKDEDTDSLEALIFQCMQIRENWRNGTLKMIEDISHGKNLELVLGKKQQKQWKRGGFYKITWGTMNITERGINSIDQMLTELNELFRYKIYNNIRARQSVMVDFT